MGPFSPIFPQRLFYPRYQILIEAIVGSGIFCVTWVPPDHFEYNLVFAFFTLSHEMDTHPLWRNEGTLFMAKREIVSRGWLSDAQSSKKLNGQWRKPSSLGMQLSAKCSGAREPTFVDVDVILLTVVFGKRDEVSKTISNQTLRPLLSSTTADMCPLYTKRCYVIHQSAPVLHVPLTCFLACFRCNTEVTTPV